jgi:hypothetical protein
MFASYVKRINLSFHLWIQWRIVTKHVARKVPVKGNTEPDNRAQCVGSVFR